MAATRTQVYLTKTQRRRLDEIRRRDGRTLAEVIREAIDEYLEHSGEGIDEAWDATAGSMPDLEVPSRDEWDRGYG
jgi:predicted DNA-binding protein